MLPQVANHIFHHTARAVAAAPAVRNVLGTGAPAPSWTGAGSSYGAGAGAGGHAGAGGSKYHAGSRFYAGYTGPGRAVTQASTSSGNADADEDDVRANLPSSSRRKFRARSQSFSLGSGAHGRNARAQSLGVLKAVQAHFRSRHAFAGAGRQQLLLPEEAVERPATPRLVRRNSTASTLSTPPSPDLPPENRSRAPSPLALPPSDAAAPQSVLPPDLDPAPLTETERLLNEANGDPLKVRAAVDRLRAEDISSVVLEWNLVIKALTSIHLPGDSVADVVSVYHDMIARNLRPDMTTYACLLDVLLQRSFAVEQSIQSIKESIARRSLFANLTPQAGQRDFMDRQTVAALEAETNWLSALTIFKTVDRVSGWAFEPSLYTTLFRACASQHDIETALQVLAHMERRQLRPLPAHYSWLIRAYTNAGDFDGARAVFEEMQRVRATSAGPANMTSTTYRWHTTTVWNEMIRAHILAGDAAAGLALLERMMDAPTGANFGPTDAPTPSAVTYDIIVDSFCEAKDYSSAITWFNRLSSQGMHVPDKRSTLIRHLPKPRQMSAEKLSLALAQDGQLDVLNEFNRGVSPSWQLVSVVYTANMRDLLAQEPGPEVASQLRRLHRELFASYDTMVIAAHDFFSPSELYAPAIAHLARSDDTAFAGELLCGILDTALIFLRSPNAKEFWSSHVAALRALFFDGNGKRRPLPLRVLINLSQTRAAQRFSLPEDALHALVTAFNAEVRQKSDLGWLKARDWDFIAYAVWRAAKSGHLDTIRALDVLSGMAQAGLPPTEYTSSLVQVFVDSQGVAAASELLKPLGPAYEALVAAPPSASATPELSSSDSGLSSERPTTADTTLSSQTERIDPALSRSLKQSLFHITPKNQRGVEDAWQLFSSQAQIGAYPEPAEIGSLIQHLGRMGHVERLYEAYDVAQRALATLGEDAGRLNAWGAIEGGMVIGLAHAGDGQRADAHRQRMLEQDLTPSADAYAALIQAVRDTTDDTSVAMTYFDEAMARGVEPNLFLFNTAISKLAKARKAEPALRLFEQMKTLGIRCTPVTYGAVIGACCRVGDIASAETLFEEMMTARYRKKLRVPPFNTMMQFFVQTKPNRARVLQYYTRLCAEGILPSTHTYKLVLDAYGSIEPVDFPAMEKTFEALCKDPNVAVEGVHWASLINAYGCVGKDLDKAIATFESIATHPTTPASGVPIAGAVVYEALINVFVTHRRIDLVGLYLDRLRASGVHMTAYIANLLIRGHALIGDIQTARTIFETMHDPPAGVAAPNNHAPHDTYFAAKRISPDALVYREPSTWEAMIRAELGQSNRQEALALLDRLATRHYPESIYKRINGIMLDDSVSPWPAVSPGLLLV